jgi:hypothetical protein
MTIAATPTAAAIPCCRNPYCGNSYCAIVSAVLDIASLASRPGPFRAEPQRKESVWRLSPDLP